jgi:hypothetical protein
MVALSSSQAAANLPIVYEPGLPWLTPEIAQNPPLGYSGIRLIFRRIELTNDSMVPHFPVGAIVNVTRVIALKNLVVGRVYYREWLTSPFGEGVAQMARLLSIHDTYLLVQCDNARVPTIWPLGESAHNPLCEVWEVTHYVHYPTK